MNESFVAYVAEALGPAITPAECYRTVFVNEGTGEMYVSLALVCIEGIDPRIAYECYLLDGKPLIKQDKHTYILLDWMLKEYERYTSLIGVLNHIKRTLGAMKVGPDDPAGYNCTRTCI